MDDLSEKLSAILKDPESMGRVKQMAENLMGGSKKEESPLPDGIDIGKIMSVVGKFKQTGGEKEKLLLALRPHLRPERQQRLDTAVRILKLLELAPLLKDSGIF